MILDLNRDHSENITYSYPGHFLFIDKDRLSHYPQYTGLSHWHDDTEFIAVLSGEMDYSINGRIVHMSEGDGLFVNSRQFHYGFSKGRRECVFLCILLHPMLLCSTPSMEQDYITPVLSNAALPYQLLHEDIPWEKKILQALRQMYDALGQPAFPLLILSLFCQIWREMYIHAPQDGLQTADASGQLSIIREMVHYIQKNHAKKISLDDIAAAGNVCKSKCCSLFHRYLNQTPVNYLIRYRLDQSIGLMTSTDMNITQISYEVGFSGTSYFSETFRRHFGCSPMQYRKRALECDQKGADLTPF